MGNVVEHMTDSRAFFATAERVLYFPRVLRWVPHAYDRVIGARPRKQMFIFVFRLTKAGTRQFGETAAAGGAFAPAV